MKLDVFDTYANNGQGKLMHFDVLLPQGSSQELAEEIALRWLKEVGVDTETVELQSCRFCHSEPATPEVEQALNSKGYAILQMEGCPATNQ